MSISFRSHPTPNLQTLAKETIVKVETYRDNARDYGYTDIVYELTVILTTMNRLYKEKDYKSTIRSLRRAKIAYSKTILNTKYGP